MDLYQPTWITDTLFKFEELNKEQGRRISHLIGTYYDTDEEAQIITTRPDFTHFIILDIFNDVTNTEHATEAYYIPINTEYIRIEDKQKGGAQSITVVLPEFYTKLHKSIINTCAEWVLRQATETNP